MLNKSYNKKSTAYQTANTLPLNKIASAMGLCFLLGQTVIAQETDNTSEDEVEKIIVFATSAKAATKTDAALVEIPQSISVVTSDQFAERGAINFQDIFRYSAGVSTEDNGVDARYDSFSSRGFSTVQYLDGLNRQPDFIYGARMEVFTIERAEVLRGPSAVLYGAGSAGGLLNAVSKTPRPNFGGEFAVQLGTDNRQQIMADVTGGLNEDVATRFVAVIRDGNLQPEDQADDRFLLMPSVSWTVSDDTDITVLFLYQKDNMGTQTYYGVDFSAEKPPIDFFAGDKGYNHMDAIHTSGTLMIDHSFSDDINYSGRTRFFDQSTDYAEVYGYFPDTASQTLSRGFYFLDENYKVLNSDHNLKFDFETGDFEHQVLVGLDYTEFRQEREEGFGFGPEAVPSLDLTNPDYHVTFPQEVGNAYTSRSTQLGMYLQDQIKYDEWLSLVLGVRRDKSTSQLNEFKEEPNHATTVRLGVIADVGAGFSPYIGYSESFNPIFGADFYGVPYKPQSGEQTEVGLKYQPNKDTLITVAYYDVEESNRLVADPDEIQNFLQAGSIESKGYEIEVATTLFDTLNITAAYSHTDSIVADNTVGSTNLKVGNVPEKLASVWMMNQFVSRNDISFNAGVGVRYVGDKTDTANLFTTPSVTLVDVSMNLMYQNWSVRLNVNNALNKEYYATCSALVAPTIGFCAPAMDRSIVATLSRKF